MKKKIIWIVSVVLALVLLAGAAIGLVFWGRSRQSDAHADYNDLRSNLEQVTLTVTEGSETVGVYSLQDLGLLETALAQSEDCFSVEEKLSEDEFAQLSIFEQGFFQTSDGTRAVTMDSSALYPVEVLVNLMDMERVKPVDAYAQWSADGYTVVPEVHGTELDYDVIYKALEAVVTDWVVTPDNAENKTLDVAACNAYLQPAVTETVNFDYEALLAEATEELVIPVQLLTETVEVPVQPLVSVDADGKGTVDVDALTALVEEWAEKCPEGKTDFILDSYERGPVPLDFLQVTYGLDKDTLLEMLVERMGTLDGSLLKAPYFCERNGEAFTLGDTYVEVDIARQKMVFFCEGEVVTYTDVVTGLPWGYWTWPGFYNVKSMDTDRMLTAPDYSVHVNYWVGIGGEYGLHDAEWREIYGGERYLTDGSHGCVNTPMDAMKAIYEKIQMGDPVIIHFVELEEETVENPEE